MEGYGEADAKRGRIIKRLILWGLAILIVGGSGYFYFRTWNEKKVMDQFMARIQQKDLEGAYRMWCTAEKPCPYYPLDKFQADFGAGNAYSNVSSAKIEHVDYCQDGVVFNITYPNAEPLGLWVERSTGIISYAPWPRCPSKRLTFGPLMERLFGSRDKG
jgi:hypothetical protein